MEYKYYDNYDAIEVSKVKNIPINWGGIMGVPITFLDHYNPNYFKIIGYAAKWDSENVGYLHKEGTPWGCVLDGKNLYARIFIRWKRIIADEVIFPVREKNYK
jgi:hypothetical protein